MSETGGGADEVLIDWNRVKACVGENEILLDGGRVKLSAEGDDGANELLVDGN